MWKFIQRLTLATFTLAAGAATAHATGALAIDSNQGSRFGYSYGFGSQEAANQRALNECGRRGCHVVVRFRHACAAYAADQTRGSNVYGWGMQSPGIAGGSSERRARNRAIAECEARAGGNGECVVRVWACDP